MTVTVSRRGPEHRKERHLAAQFVPADVKTDGPVRVEVYPGREVVVEFDPDLTFDCVDDCTWCCHHGVLLYDRDLIELATRANLAETTTDFRGETFITREEKTRDEHVADDGNACAFLRDDGLCSLHLGGDDDWKPTRCSVFPLGVWREASAEDTGKGTEGGQTGDGTDSGQTGDDADGGLAADGTGGGLTDDGTDAGRPGDLHVGIRDSAHEHCEGLGVSDRRVIDHLDAFLPELLWELENPDSERVL